MKRPEKLLGDWANRVEERIKSNLAPKWKLAESTKNVIKIENARFDSDYIIQIWVMIYIIRRV